MYLLPVPQKMEQHSGTFSLGLHTCIVIADNSSALTRTAASQLQEEIASVCGVSLPVIPGVAREGDLLLTVDPALASQSYTLTIDEKQMVLRGGDPAGLLHGAQTLRQIIRQSGWRLPALSIQDKPAYPARGFYHDVSRGRTPTMAFLKQLADEACLYKLNQLQLYVEHTYLFRDMSEVWMAGEPLNAEEIMELDDYCAARGIELVPSLSSFGHLLELLRTKSYCELCELPDADKMPSSMYNRMAHHTLNVTDPRSIELVKRMIGEFMPLFHSRIFNICADETFDLGKGRNRELMAQTSERELYIGFVKQICDFVVSQGRTPMFWGDIVVRFAEALNMLPEGTICLNWGYGENEKEDVTRILAENGAIQYVCPGVSGWNQIMNKLRYSYENITRMAAYGRKHGAVGLLNTDWGDHGHINDPRFSLPGMIYGAHFSWSDAPLSFEEINEAVSHLAYGDRSGAVMSHLANMQDCDVYGWFAVDMYKEWKVGDWNGNGNALEKSVNHRRFATVAEANAELAGIADGLKECALHMDSATRPMIARWLLAAEGMTLWNLVGLTVWEGRKDAALASRLENWYHRYESMWREVSKESELWRIRDVVRWYGREQLR